MDDVSFSAHAATRPNPQAARGAAVTARGLGRRFGDKTVLASLDLHVPAGQFVAIIGKSGCGKSTLLRLLAGLDEPDAGNVALGGGASPRKDARVMFQEPRLLPWANVIDNVYVGLGSVTRDAAAIDRAETALAAVGLADRAGDWPSILSGGQKQRLALARALVSSPRFLALDEPLGALDALTRIEMQRLLEDIWLQKWFTVALVTHDVSEALALADRIILIEDGRITLDVPVDLPRPRQRGSVRLAELEGEILARLLQDDKRT